jgi:hypothetical protein
LGAGGVDVFADETNDGSASKLLEYMLVEYSRGAEITVGRQLGGYVGIALFCKKRVDAVLARGI